MSKKENTLIRYEDESILIETFLLDDIPSFVLYNKHDRTTKIFDNTIKIHNTEYIALKKNNPFITNRAIIFPTDVLGSQNVGELIADIKKYVYKYSDTSEGFLTIIPYFVLLTYVYEDFAEIPYLRVIGDYGSGKTRLLKVVGNISYNAIITSPGTSISAIFRMIEKTAGTLVLDEADFMKSDTTSDMIKLLNNGYSKGNPIFRADKEGFELSVYRTFCPKILGGRREFQDQATESRCISEIMQRTKRDDIPINLTKEFDTESENLRNRLYAFRGQFAGSIVLENAKIPGIDGRLNQILNPILTLVKMFGSETDYKKILNFFHNKQKDITDDRKNSLEGLLFQVIKDRENKNDIYVSYAELLQDMSAFDERMMLTSRKIGAILKQYNIVPERKNSGFFINIFDNKKSLQNAYAIFGI